MTKLPSLQQIITFSCTYRFQNFTIGNETRSIQITGSLLENQWQERFNNNHKLIKEENKSFI